MRNVPLIAGLSCLAVAIAGAGCASSVSPTACAFPGELEVTFAPMYSAYESSHTYQIPAIVNGVEPAGVTWSASDNSLVSLSHDPITQGVMITVKGSGTVTITASAGNICGSSVLTIDAATTDDWKAGEQRYNNGVDLRADAGRGTGLGGADAGNKTLACTNCHGITSNGPFKDVAHTPEQIGGFSDTDLDAIIRTGTVPDGGYFDDTIVAYEAWHQFHTWTMTDSELAGVIVYLRSLTPIPQAGTANFGGRGGTGGSRDGGPRNPPPDAGLAADAG